MIANKIKNKSLVIVLTVFLSLTGCMFGPNFKKPVVQITEKYRFSDSQTESAVNLKWWELFDDPVLYSLVITALENNKTLLIAASRIEQARATLGFIEADFYPKFDIEAAASRGTYAAGRKVKKDDIFFIAPTLSWEIDFWGKFRRANEAALAELMASEFSLRTVQISLISEVAATYFLLLDYRQSLEISKQTLESRTKSLNIIQQRFDKGIIPEIDLNQAQIQKEIAQASIPVYERLIAQTENTLSILLGKMPGDIQKGTDLHNQTLPPEIPAGLPSSLLERRPDIMEAESILHAETARIGVAEALRFPSIGLTAIAGYASNDLSTLISEGDSWSMGASLFAPIFDFDKNKLRVVIQEKAAQQALYNYQNTVLFAFKEVEDALIEVKTYSTQIESVTRQYEAAKNAVSLSNMRYDKGVTSYLEVLESERQLFSVALELSQVKREYLNSYVRLYKALGGGWISKEDANKSENY